MEKTLFPSKKVSFRRAPILNEFRLRSKMMVYVSKIFRSSEVGIKWNTRSKVGETCQRSVHYTLKYTLLMPLLTIMQFRAIPIAIPPISTLHNNIVVPHN